MATFYCLAEYNAWEDEHWYHYFADSPGVLDALQSVYDRGDYVMLDSNEYNYDEAEFLTNLDEGDYMQKHWFGCLTNLEGLMSATEDDLSKGKIRDFGEELFE